MDFIAQLQSLGKNIEKQDANITTEEAIKNVFVKPFIQALGYDLFDPSEVLHEFTADVGCNKGEGIDYAICIDGKPTLLFDCKSGDVDLHGADAAELRRYFHVTSARIGVLTNGRTYSFYTDLEKQNIMDDKPYMELDLLDIDEQLIPELKKLSKNSFDLEQIFTVANESRYIRAIKRVLVEEFSSPSSELIRFLASQVYPGIKTQQVLDQFTPIVKEACAQFVNDRINDHSGSALNGRFGKAAKDIDYTNNGFMTGSENDRIVTDEEFESFFVVNIT